jgi:hypothetical protein
MLRSQRITTSKHEVGSQEWLDESYALYCDGMYGKQILSRIDYEGLYKRIKNVKL